MTTFVSNKYIYMIRLILLFFLVLITSNVLTQGKQKYNLAIVAFYNLENYYDTVHNPIVNDNEFTPLGEKNYTGKIYRSKTENLATVIAKIGTDEKPISIDGPTLLGVAEIENDTVLNDLIHHPLISKRSYEYVHYDSKDLRGIDVALIYNPKRFVVIESKALILKIKDNPRFRTRDILWVKGKLDGEIIHIYVNHWPSRLGGEEASAPYRAAAATLCKKHIDSIAFADGLQKVIIMGDLNDDPNSASVIKILGAKEKIEDVKKGGIYNPWIEVYKRGSGTLAYNDSWSLFDQIMVSSLWLNKQQTGYFYMKQHIFNRAFMTESIGQYKGYPMRTFDGNNYRGGYSDHYPTYIVLLRKVL